MNIVSLTGYTPVPRYDGQHWTIAQLQEAPLADGPWTTIQSYVLNPVDANPKDPDSRDFTSDQATLNNGWYRILWQDAAANTSASAPVQGAGGYSPSVQQVASKDLSRTRDTFGNLVGTFTASTTPTDTQVFGIINTVIQEISDVIGDEVPDDLNDDASNVVALRAAMQIELDFFPDQVNTDRSIYPQLKEQYQAALMSLQRAVTLFNEGETAVTDSGPSNKPSYGFPTSSGWGCRRW